MKPWILRIGGFAHEEHPFVTASGFETIEVNASEIVSKVSRLAGFGDRDVILRCERLPDAIYAKVAAAIRNLHGNVVNDPDGSRLLSNFGLHYPYIEAVSPPAIVLPSSSTATVILDHIVERRMAFPVFVKTELKSLKDNSVLSGPTRQKLEDIVERLRNAFAPFETFVIKEMVDLQKVGGETLEYRSFVLDGRVVHRESGRRDLQLPDARKNGAATFVETVIDSLSRSGFPRHYIIDVAKRAQREEFIVVEIKDAQFTKAKCYEEYWASMARQLS